MKISSVAIALGVLLANTANAGCFDYEESGSEDTPLVKICFDDTCDVVRQNFICSTSTEAMAGFDGGWHFTYRVDRGVETRVVSWNGTVLPPEQAARITCEVLYGSTGSC